MQKVNAIRLLVFVVIVTGFLLGVVQLFLLRFEAGDVYPAYSTLRSDPVGSRAFYSGLQNLDTISVQRNYKQLTHLEFDEPGTFFYIGTPIFDFESVSTRWVETIERLTASGGRLIMSFLPVEKKPANWRMTVCREAPTEKPEDKKTPSQGKANNNENFKDSGDDLSEDISRAPPSGSNRQCQSLNEQWGVQLAFADMPATEAVRSVDGNQADDQKRLPPVISWHTAVYFDVLDDNWRVIYSAESRPVIIERPLGNGSLVLAADSYFMSNEALRTERHAELLAWTVGRHPTIVFDETHLDIRKHPGVLSLIKKHRFHWLIFAFAILALLFIWKNSIYFVPPSSKSTYLSGQNVYAGRDSTQGLVSLLRRNIPARQLLHICAREWRRAFQLNRKYSSGKSDPSKSLCEKLEACAAQSKDPVAGYRQMSKIILRGRHNE